MKTLTYSISINKPQEFVFNKVMDQSIYPDWAKAWGEGMTYTGEWKEGSNISFMDHSQGGTKVVIEEFIANESIKMKHIAMVNPQNVECEVTDETMEKWIGSREDYFFKKVSDTETIFEVVVMTDEAFEEMMNAWHKALEYFKEACEA